MPAMFNLEFVYNHKDAAALVGGGVYVTYYKRELLYVGIFTGERGTVFASDVASQRFYKHLEALTLRGRTIGFTEQNYDRAIALARPNCPLISALKATGVPRGNGSVKTYPGKVAFASDNWTDFSQIEHVPEVLENFTFVYGRTSAAHFATDVSYQQVKNYLGAVESHTIERHKPLCNERLVPVNPAHLEVGPPLESWGDFFETVSNPRPAAWG